MLSDHIGISQNHLSTLLKQTVGMPPKQLAHPYRFAHLHCSIDPTQPVDWALLARQFGYYDQWHLYKDFMALIGHTPTDYLQHRRQLHSEAPERKQFLRRLPID